MRTSVRILALALALTPASRSDALDPTRAVSQYVLTRWGAGSVPGSGILALAQTRDGYLWLGSGSGLARFDGVRFVAYTANQTPGFADGGVSQLAEGADGSLYLGSTNGAVTRYKDGAFSPVPMPLGAGAVHAILPARDGSLWISVHGRAVHRLVGDSAVSLFKQVGAGVPMAIVQDGHGVIWLATWGDGLIGFEGDTFTRYPVLHDTVQALLPDREGALWIGTPHGLYRRGADGTLSRFTTRDGLSHDGISSILEDHDGNLWIGTTGGGLNRLREGRFTHLTIQEGLPDDEVRTLLEDHDGNLWVGTADGLSCLSDGRFTTYGRFEGLPDPAVPSVAPGAGGTVWIGTRSAGIARLRDGVLTHFRLPLGIGKEAVLSLYEDRHQALWIALENGRVFRLKDGVVTEHTPELDQPTFKVRVIFEDDAGPIFCVPQLGPSHMDGRRLVPLHPEAPTSFYVHCLYRQGATLWMGTAHGLARVAADGQYRVFGAVDGLPHDRVRGVEGDEDGALWVATIGGLAYLKDDKIRTLTVDQGLPENYLRFVVDDKRGYLWIGSTGHIARLSKQEIHEVFAGARARVTPFTFDASDGLRTTEAILSNSPAFRGADGRLWFATARGVSMVDPARITTDEPAPDVHIEQVTVDGRVRASPEYPPGRGEVLVEYAAFGFQALGKMRFRYQMEGFDADWIVADSRRAAYYSNLPPGRYTFRVMASNRDGVWNGKVAVVPLSLRPPFYKTALFYAMATLLLLAAAAAIHRVRLGQIRARFALIVGERTRIARELHDTLAQGLAGVGLQIDTALDRLPSEPAADPSRRNMRLARRMVDSSLGEVRRSIWVLRTQASKDEDGFSRSLAQSLEHLTADSGLRPRLRVSGTPRVLGADVERHLLRIAHESVTNAVRHAEATTLAIDLRFEDDGVHLRVCDDGRGFDPEAALSAPEGEHFGLMGIAERVDSIGGEWKIDSRPGAGTELNCRLPYESRTETAEVDSVEGISL
jgi:signal transduction histidine kinase/ligand-binding sensor domain-containing protein